MQPAVLLSQVGFPSADDSDSPGPQAEMKLPASEHEQLRAADAGQVERSAACGSNDSLPDSCLMQPLCRVVHNGLDVAFTSESTDAVETSLDSHRHGVRTAHDEPQYRGHLQTGDSVSFNGKM